MRGSGCASVMFRVITHHLTRMEKSLARTVLIHPKCGRDMSSRAAFGEVKDSLNNKMVQQNLWTHLFNKIQLLHTESEDQNFHVTTEEELAKLTKEVISKAGSKDIMVGSIPEMQVKTLVLDLQDLGLQATDILSLLSSTPAYVINHRKLVTVAHKLMTQALNAKQVSALLHTFPAIVEIPVNQISKVVGALRDAGFHETPIQKIISAHPFIFLLSPVDIHKRIMLLRQLLKSTDVVTVVRNCPQVLTDDWDEIQAKFDYVFHEMNITQKQMVYASVFSHSLSHIQRRHAFLVRAGFFSMEKRREGEKSPNDRLDRIISSSDKAFCSRFGGFDVAEYRTFCKLFAKEQATLAEDSDTDLEN